MQYVAAPIAPESGTAAANLVDMLRQRAAGLDDKVAFRFIRGSGEADDVLTYRDLNARAVSVAVALQGLAAPGDRALLLFPPGLDFVAAFFGCLYAGVVAVPITPPGRNRYTSSIEAIFDAASPALILSTADLCQQSTRTYAHLPKLTQRPWVAVDEIADALFESWQEPQIDGCRTAFLQYTSGSTSSPKGVMLSHDNLLANAACIEEAFGNSPQSSAVFWLPLYHDMGLIGGVLQPLYCGGSCTLLAPASFLQRPALWLETISQTRATVSGGPDFAFDLCARKVSPEERRRLDLSSWQVAFMGAERIRAQTLERFAEVFSPCGFRREAFFPCYGLAESTLMASGGPRGVAPVVVHVDAAALAQNSVLPVDGPGPEARSLVGCGEPLPGERIAIVNPQTRLPCAADQIGEIWVQSPSVARGYHEQPQATATAFGAYLAGYPTSGHSGGDHTAGNGNGDGDGLGHSSLHFRKPLAGPHVVLDIPGGDSACGKGKGAAGNGNSNGNGHLSLADSAVLPDGPFLRTGDLGFLRHGQLFVTGRLKDLILIRGRNHYPEDIEHSAERSHEAFRPGYCAAFAVEADERERLVVVQELEPRRRDVDHGAAVQAIRRVIAQRHGLEIYAIALVRAGSIPKTSSGKTRRSACRQQFYEGRLEIVTLWTADHEETLEENWAGEVAADPRAVTVAQIEQWLQQRIAARLGIPLDEVHAGTPFLEFGMGSIDAVEIAAELERWLCRRLSPTAVYNHPNIAALAQWLAAPQPDPETFDQVAPAALPAVSLDPQQLLREVQAMTDEDLEVFLRQELAKEGREP